MASVAPIDATQILGASKKRKIDATLFPTRKEGEELPTVDLALLAVYDTGLLDEAAYTADREAYLQASTRDNVQILINSIFNRPTTVNDDGFMASLPTEPLLVLPREKALPKPKPPTKWERFAAQKGIISKSKKERHVFDEEKQEWVPRYGYKGKNKDKEDQWLVEVPAGKPADYDPRAAAKEERKARKLKNESQQLRNQANSNVKASTSQANDLARKSRKAAVERDLLSTKKSTASLGRFDKPLPGEQQKRPQGEKRKFDANEVSAGSERERDTKILKSLAVGAGSGGKRADGERGGVVSARKAVRSATRAGAGKDARKAGRGKKR